MTTELPIETFPALEAVAGIRHGFTGRVPGLDVKVDRELALQRLDEHHAAARTKLGLGDQPFIFAQQVHGREVARVGRDTIVPVPAADGLITDEPGVTLGIYVADCCAIYLVDPVRRAIGLLHSGRKGTEFGIATAAIEKMRDELGCEPSRMIVQLSPCIRPPRYEVDFAADIAKQCRAAGVREVFDPGTCTASNLDRYYSYRAELGKTGRMLALLALG